MLQIMDEAKDSVISIHISDHEILTGSADCQLRRYDIRSGLLHTDFIGCESISFLYLPIIPLTHSGSLQVCGNYFLTVGSKS